MEEEEQEEEDYPDWVERQLPLQGAILSASQEELRQMAERLLRDNQLMEELEQVSSYLSDPWHC